MKKAIAVLAALVLALSLASCGGKNENVSSQPVQAAQPAGWVSNEYTDVLPQVPPKMTYMSSHTPETGNAYSVMLGGGTIEKAKSYMQSLKDAGFTQNASEGVYDQIDMCMFTGTNEKGFTVEMIYSAGTLALTVRK